MAGPQSCMHPCSSTMISKHSHPFTCFPGEEHQRPESRAGSFAADSFSAGPRRFRDFEGAG
eukprot:14710388-Alexandrium_andersonii.AAC.1